MSQPKTFEDGVDIILARMKQVLISKHRDYGVENILVHGELGVIVRASDKLHRLNHLYSTSQQPVNESIDDSWLDLANYSVIALLLREGFFTLPLESEK